MLSTLPTEAAANAPRRKQAEISRALFLSNMSKKFLCLMVVAAAISVRALAQSAPVATNKAAASTPEFAVWLDGKRIIIPTGTPIKLQTTEKIYAKKLSVDTEIALTVADDVKIGDTIVFKKDAPAKGVVTFAKGAKNWNKGSKWEFNVLWTTAADGRRIPTLTHFKERARNDKLNTVLSLGITSPFSKGKQANIKKGAIYKVTVGNELPLPEEKVAEVKGESPKAKK